MVVLSSSKATLAAPPALAKQNEQLRSQRRVTSRRTQHDEMRWSGHSPQSYGQPRETSVAGRVGGDGRFARTQLEKAGLPRQMIV